jgi:DNA-binding NtrC family response regulator
MRNADQHLEITKLREALSTAREEITKLQGELAARTEELARVRTTAAEQAAATADDAFDGTLETIEKRVLDYVLTRTAGNKSEAARMLGLKRTTFLDKLRRHGVSATRPPPRSARH